MTRLFISLTMLGLFAACQRLPLKTFVDPVNRATAQVREHSLPAIVKEKGAALTAWAWKPAYSHPLTAREHKAIAIGLDLIVSP